MVKRIMAILMSVMMLFSTFSFDAVNVSIMAAEVETVTTEETQTVVNPDDSTTAAEPEETTTEATESEEICNHTLTQEDVDHISEDFWKTHDRSEFVAGAPAFLAVEVPAGCTVAGWHIAKTETTGFCMLCGKIITEGDKVTDPKIGHSKEYEVIKDATCVEPGVKQCTNYNYELKVEQINGIYSASLVKERCNDTQEISAMGHQYTTEVHEPTCTEAGYTVYTCEREGCAEETPEHSYIGDEVPALDHNFEVVKRVEPTCTVKGYIEYRCTRCDETYTENIAELKHDHKETVIQKATCYNEGTMLYTCSRCGDKYTESIPKLEHTGLQITSEPTCIDSGKEEGTCELCGRYIVQSIEPLGHHYVAEVKKATCTEDGYTVYVCDREVCAENVPGHSYIGSYEPALGHDWKAVNTVEPTCTEDGYTEYQCQREECGETKKDDIKEALGHDYVADETLDEITKEPTCTQSGTKVHYKKCTRCDDVVVDYEETLAPLKHDFQITETVEAGCETSGRNVYTCTRCGEAYVEYLPPLGHKFDEDEVRRIPANCVHGNIFRGTCTRCEKVIRTEDEERDYSIEFRNAEKYSFERMPDEVAEDTYHVNFKYTGDNSYYNEYSEEFDILSTISHTGHKYEAKYTKATCEKDGYWTLTCVRENCPNPDAETAKNEVVTVVNANTATGHNWALLDDDSAKEPTCTEDGYRHYMCLNDHAHTYTEKLPATGHTYTFVDSFAATCVEGGYNLYKCDICGAEYKEYITAKVPHNYVVTDTVAATCTTEGYDVYTCSECGDTYKQTTTKALGHGYKITKSVAPTCAEEGYNIYTCTRCEDSYKEMVAKIPHKYAVTDTVAATCTEEGCDVYTCSECGDTYNQTTTKALGHGYKITKSVAPTCTKEGYNEYTCTRCKDSYTEKVAKLAHNFVEVNYQAPTCTKQGVRTFKCVECDKSYEATEKALGHNYGKTEIVPATCTEKGYTVHTCTNPGCADSYRTDETDKVAHVLSVEEQKDATCAVDGYVVKGCANCEYTEKEVIPATGNHYYSNKVTKVATCTEDGVMTYTCQECGKTYTEVIPAIGHDYGKVEVIPATCTEKGYTVHTCTNPGCIGVDDEGKPTGKPAEYITNETPKVDHALSIIEQEDATCTKNGYVVRGCTNCGYEDEETKQYIYTYTEKEVLPATGHTFDTEGVNTPATCEKEGYTTYTCAVCGEKAVVKTAEKLGHVYKSEVAIVGGINKAGATTEKCIHCGKAIVSSNINAIKSVKLAATTFAYSGKKETPAVIVTDSKGNTVSSKYYTVKYANNKKIGKATATITFKGIYSGTVVKKFTIVPKGIGISNTSSTKKTIKYTWGRVKNCDGYKIQYSTSKKFKKAKKITIKNRKTCVRYLKNLKSGKKYYVRVRAYKKVGGKTYYGEWSSSSRTCK